MFQNFAHPNIQGVLSGSLAADLSNDIQIEQIQSWYNGRSSETIQVKQIQKCWSQKNCEVKARRINISVLIL